MTMLPDISATVLALPKNSHRSLAEPDQMRVIKRDGQEVSYDTGKIFHAIEKCLLSCGRSQATTVLMATQVMEQVDHFLRWQVLTPDSRFQPLNIEVIQNIVEIQLMAVGAHDAAKHYILYRDERRRLREESQKISPELRGKFKEGCSYFSTGNALIRQAQYFDKFSRFNWDWKRRETWLETVDRTMSYFQKHAHERFPGAVSEDLWAELKQGLIQQEATPSLRTLQMAGPALERCQTGTFNCSYLEMDSPESLAEDLYLLMSGVGVGFSVEEDVVDRWPRVQKQRGGGTVNYIIQDDTESWCDGLKFGVYQWLGGGDVNFDTSLVRLKGSILRTKGGRASGPGPLKDLLSFARSLILRRQGKKLRTIDVHDLTCMTHRVGQLGGVRRASGLSASSLDDLLMRHAKDGAFYNEHPYRNQANDAAVYDCKPTAVEFMEEWLSLAKSGSGERGILNRWGVQFQIPKRRQLRRFGLNPCLVGETSVWTADGRGAVPIKELAEEGKSVPVFCMDDQGKLTIRQMRHPRVTGYQEPVVKVTFDETCSIRVTRNHRFLLKNGSYCQAKDLKPGMSIKLITRYTPEQTDPQSQSRSDRYIFSGCGGDSYYEHAMIAEFHSGRMIVSGEHVHHKNENRMDNSPGNLEIRNGLDHMSEHSEGLENPNSSGVSNDQMIEIGRNLVKSLGRRFSTAEWMEMAQALGLPQHFSSWREKSIGSLQAFSKRCASLEGLDEKLSDVDPRMARSYKRLVSEGLDAEIVDGKIFIRKVCENCSVEFTVPRGRREVCFCSLKCHKERNPESPETRNRRLNNQASVFDHRRRELRLKQLDIYSQLKNSLGREPMKKEWVTECRKSGLSAEISRQSSPFTSWSSLTQAGIDHNHRVTSVVEDGYEDVYNGTVDDHHNFCVGGWDGGLTAKGRRRQWWCVNAQCGEILLRSQQFCCLSVAIAGMHDSIDALRKKIRLATVWGKMQASMTRFRYLRPTWKDNTEDESLLGVDILGHMDCNLLRPGAPHQSELLQMFRQEVVDLDLQLSRRFNMNQSASTTCGKPSGDSSVLFDKPAGFKPHHGRRYLRRMRFSQMNPVARVLQDAGVPWEHEYDKAGNVVFEFPCSSPEGTMIMGDQTAIEQLENWKVWKVNYTEHNPSCTVSVKEDEWLAVGHWVYSNWEIVGGLSFLPYDGGIYPQAPYQTLTEEEYWQRMESMPTEIDWSRITLYEESDLTELAGTFACSAGGCEI